MTFKSLDQKTQKTHNQTGLRELCEVGAMFGIKKPTVEWYIYTLKAPRETQCFALWILIRRKRKKELSIQKKRARRDRDNAGRRTEKYREKEKLRRKRPDQILRQKKWRSENRERLLKWYRIYDNMRRRNDPVYAMARALRARLHKKLRIVGSRKGYRMDILTGCTSPELKAHIEKQFKAGMTWGNRGTIWHVDHVRPLSSFDLKDPEQQKQACHYTNLQPLYAWENMAKGDKVA